MNKETKEIKNILFIVCLVWIITAGTAGIIIKKNNQKNSEIAKYRQVIKEFRIYTKEIDSLYQNQSQINLILRPYINDSEEEKLKQDTNYINLVTK